MGIISAYKRMLAATLTSVLTLLSLSALTAIPAAAEESENLALKATVTASGQEVAGKFAPAHAADGVWAPADRAANGHAVPPAIHNAADASRWSANSGNGPWWIQYEFPAEVRIDSVTAEWGNTFATSYYLEVSEDGVSWQKIADGLKATKQTEKVTTTLHNPVTAHYLRLTATKKSQNFSLSLWELAVHGEMIGRPLTNDANSITPKPLSVNVSEDADPFVFTSDTCVSLSSKDLEPALDILRATLEKSYGLTLPVRDDCAIHIDLDPHFKAPRGQANESYQLVVTDKNITITASRVRGAIWAVQSLIQLIGPWASAQAQVAEPAAVPQVRVIDAPRYAWRGVMLDPCRSFIPVDEIKKYVDLMSTSKLNVLHMHISEDQGWRLEISNDGKEAGDSIDYEQLIKKSSLTSYMAGSSHMAPEAGRTGYYTKADYADIIRYAASRGIAVITEVDGPGHTNSALHAIPELNTAGASPKPPAGATTTAPFVDGKDGFGTLDLKSEATYTFMRHVIADIAKQHSDALASISNSALRADVTLPYFHIGGDESTGAGEGYKNYIGRLSDIARQESFTPIVWNDALAKAPDSLAEGSVVQHWTGSTAALSAFTKNKNGKVLMSTVNNAYYPQRPGSDVAGPTWACAQGCTLSNWYNWDPTAQAGVAESSVLGVESALWQEHLRTDHDAQFVMFPRTFALAEVAWSQNSAKDYDDFRSRLAARGIDLINRGVTFRLSAPNDVDAVAWAGAYSFLAQEKNSALSSTQAADIGLLALPGVTAADTSRLPLTASLIDKQGVEHQMHISYAMERAFNYSDEGKTTGRQMNSIIRVKATLAQPICAGGAGTPANAVTEGTLRISGTIPADNRAPELALNAADMAVKVSEECPPGVSDSGTGPNQPGQPDLGESGEPSEPNPTPEADPHNTAVSSVKNGNSASIRHMPSTGSQTGLAAIISFVLLAAGVLLVKHRQHE